MIDYIAATALLIGAQYLDVRTTNKIIDAGGYEKNWLPRIMMKRLGKLWGPTKINAVVSIALVLAYFAGPVVILVMAVVSCIPVVLNLRVMRKMNLKLWSDYA